ncbi:hypothetical protein CASFOL_022019 [Castilleja foliolosa]|uniref:BZIP domain-containing protein n=1 Tax=Castilleja foliolosa TaxID=1961234 RepID=A0ABD3CYA1_9LAMI
MWTSSSSSMSLSPPSPYTATAVAANPRTMEEVWKDINLAADLRHSSSRGMIFQDFFARDPPPAGGGGVPSPPPPPLQLPTMLTLSSLLLQQQQQHPPIPSPERHSGGDRKHKRMIKNRESAARSRARKQAYTNELELEVAHLLEENAKLKKQQQQLYNAAAAENRKRKPLHRTSSAPF